MVIAGCLWWLKESKRHSYFQEVRRNTWENTGWSATPQSLRRRCRKSFCKALPNTWRTIRSFGTVSMNLWRGNHTWPTWYLSTTRWLPDEERAVDAVCLYFDNAFDTVFVIILTDKLIKYRLDMWKVRIDNIKPGGVADTQGDCTVN